MTCCQFLVGSCQDWHSVDRDHLMAILAESCQCLAENDGLWKNSNVNIFTKSFWKTVLAALQMGLNFVHTSQNHLQSTFFPSTDAVSASKIAYWIMCHNCYSYWIKKAEYFWVSSGDLSFKHFGFILTYLEFRVVIQIYVYTQAGA